MNFDKKSLLVYAVTDRHWLNGKTLCSQVEEAIHGGATFIQLREKDLNESAVEQEAREIQALCQRYQVPFVLNDNVMLAKTLCADGVHVGQSDMAAQYARRIIGEDKTVGVSVSTAEQAVKAEQGGADYLGVGAIFPTNSKADAAAVTIPVLKDICHAVSIPVIAIGGITAENISELKGTGIAGAAVISAIFGHENVRLAAAELRAAIEKTVEL